MQGATGSARTESAARVLAPVIVTGAKVVVAAPCGSTDTGAVCTTRPSNSSETFTVAGEGQRPGMALARWIAAARAGRPLRLLGHPERSRDITDVRDAAHALVALGERRVTGVVNLGTGVAWTLRELVGAVAAAFGVEVTTVLEPAHPAEVDHTLADTGRLRRLIGWVPRTDLAALVARQAAAAEAVNTAVKSAAANTAAESAAAQIAAESAAAQIAAESAAAANGVAALTP